MESFAYRYEHEPDRTPWFGEVILENIDELRVAQEATGRALARREWDIGFLDVLSVSIRMDVYVTDSFRDVIRAINRLRHRDIKPLIQAQTTIGDVLRAKGGRSDQYRLSVWRGDQSDVLAHAIMDYHEPRRDGDAFVATELIVPQVVEAMIASLRADAEAPTLASVTQIPTALNS